MIFFFQWEDGCGMNGLTAFAHRIHRLDCLWFFMWLCVPFLAAQGLALDSRPPDLDRADNLGYRFSVSSIVIRHPVHCCRSEVMYPRETERAALF